MRLCYIAFGHSIHTIKWVQYFRDAGNQIMLISFYPAKPLDGIDFRYIPCSSRYSALFKIRQVKRLIAEFKPDILHAHYASSCGMVAAMTGFHPFVLSVWGDDVLEFPKKSPLHKWAIKKTIMRADFVTATSHMLADRTGKLIGGGKDIQVIPFGVDLVKFKFLERQTKKELVIGTVRNFTPKYGLQYLIRAFASLRQKHENIKLTLIGDGPIRGRLQKLAVDLGIGSDVSFPGAIPNDEVADRLGDIDIFVMPSVGEGDIFGVAAVEAMATGLPVVASRIGGLPEVIDDGQTGIIVKPGNVESLIKGLQFYILSHELRLEHGRRGRYKVEKQYDWQQNAGSMEKLYELILEGKATSNPLFKA